MKEILALCEQAKSLIIYGAGTISNILYIYLESQGLAEKVKCFAVTKMENNPPSKYGVHVLEADRAIRLYEDARILLAVQEILVEAVSQHLEALGRQDYAIIDGEKLVGDLYQTLYDMPIQNNKILFSNMKNMGYGGNPKYIAQKLLEMAPEKELDLVWVVSGKTDSFPKGIRTVEYGTNAYYAELATARIWVDNMRKNFDARKRSGQYYIQTWHGAAPIKKVEKDVEDSLPDFYVANAKRDSQMADLFLSGSRFYTGLYRKSFWYDGQIMEVGLPRQDVFWQKDAIRRKVFQYYGMNEKYSMVLYAPTFRKNFTNQFYDIDFSAVCQALRERFGREFFVAVSKHPNNRYLKYDFTYENLFMVDQYEDFEELLVAADVLITDYSGCIYDFSYTKRPIFLYQRDYESYRSDRDFYIPMEKLPYATAHSNTELVRCIREYDEGSYLQKLDAFMSGMGNYDDGTASEKVAQHILQVLSQSTEV